MMRLDDLRAKTPCIHGSMAVHFVDDDPDQRCEPRHTPVSRAEVLQAALTEPCRRCDGGGGWDESDAWDDRIREWVKCPTCGGRGRKFIDGVRVRNELHDSARGYRETLVVPLSMLEGDDT